MTTLDRERLLTRSIPSTPNQRSGIIIWEPGHAMDEPHCHTGAIEPFYYFWGECLLEAGPEENQIRAGQLAWVPEEGWHRMTVVSDEPLALFLIVTPNLRPSHTFGDDMKPETANIKTPIIDCTPDAKFPDSAHCKSRVVELRKGEGIESPGRSDAEMIYFVMRGRGRTRVGHLSGTCQDFDRLFVSPGEPYAIEATDDEGLLLLENGVLNDTQRLSIEAPPTRGAVPGRM
jgi:mannose-6-phosphate isomerase-like protein (cupin superfamily)